MHGLIRAEKENAVKLLMNGLKPSEVANIFNLPLTTVVTWNKEVREIKKSKNNSHHNKDDIREKIKINAKLINDAEARIASATLDIVKPDIPEQKWMTFQSVVSSELKNILIKAN